MSAARITRAAVFFASKTEGCAENALPEACWWVSSTKPRRKGTGSNEKETWSVRHHGHREHHCMRTPIGWMREVRPEWLCTDFNESNP